MMAATYQTATIQKIGDLLAIAWTDGREDFLPLDKLRKACPCASCAGEPDVMGRGGQASTDPTKASNELVSWNMVGGYGFQPRWADGHSSGIYTFAFLRRLGEEWA